MNEQTYSHKSNNEQTKSLDSDESEITGAPLDNTTATFSTCAKVALFAFGFRGANRLGTDSWLAEAEKGYLFSSRKSFIRIESNAF